ncbi:hypothetical protein IL306_013939 [Fusarium sp. DS 682]|nr:hypothetical protein IL306_013939 [Fusarium sp. DS 682]
MSTVIPDLQCPSNVQLPTEIWDGICSLLPRTSLSRLRLVCSTLNKITLPWVYKEICLESFGNSVERFIQIAKSPKLRRLVRELTVDTSVDLEFSYNCNHDYPFPTDLIDALPYIRHFSGLTALHLRFNQYCGEDDRVGLTIEETWEDQYRVLDTVFHCITGRWNTDRQMEIEEKAKGSWFDHTRTYPDQEDTSVPSGKAMQLQELTIANLADFHDDDLAKSEAFKALMNMPSLTSLKLLVTTEINEDHDDSIATYEEKYEFFEHLPNTWLAPIISQNLRVLSLYYRSYWGWFPKVDFRSVDLPQLEVLALGHYVFSHEWQIDWISSLGHKNRIGWLRELYLDDCPILYQAYLPSPLDRSNPGCPLLSAVLDEQSLEMHKYPMRWSHVLSRLATELKALRVFRMGHAQWGDIPQDTFEAVRANFTSEIDEDVLKHRLSNNTHRSFSWLDFVNMEDGEPENEWEAGRLRYIEYNIQYIPLPWNMSFRSGDLDDEGFEVEHGTWPLDHAALERILSIVK